MSPRAASEANAKNAAGGASVADGGAFIGAPRQSTTTTTSTSTTATTTTGSAAAVSAFRNAALLMRSRAKAASERAAASIKAADLGSAWHGAVDAAGAALAATEEKIRKIAVASSSSPYLSSSSSSSSLSSICKAEASARPCPRLAIVACASIAADAARAASERAFVADAPLELAGFVLAELDESAGVSLPPPGTSPAIMATALKHFLANLPDPLVPAKCLPDFIGAGVKGAPPSAAVRAAASLPPAPAAVLSLLVETMSRIATAGGGGGGTGGENGEGGSVAGAPTPLELAESLVPCISWHPGAPKPTVAPSSTAAGASADGGSNQQQQHSPSSASAGGGSAFGGNGSRHPRAELTPGEAAAVARAVEILVLTAADRASGLGGGLFFGGGGSGGGGGGGGSFGGGSSFGGDSEPASPMGFFGTATTTGGGGGGGDGA